MIRAFSLSIKPSKKEILCSAHLFFFLKKVSNAHFQSITYDAGRLDSSEFRCLLRHSPSAPVVWPLALSALPFPFVHIAAVKTRPVSPVIYRLFSKYTSAELCLRVQATGFRFRDCSTIQIHPDRQATKKQAPAVDHYSGRSLVCRPRHMPLHAKMFEPIYPATDDHREKKRNCYTSKLNQSCIQSSKQSKKVKTGQALEL